MFSTLYRLNQEGAALCTSIFKLPLLVPPRDGLIALLSLPASAKLHASGPAEIPIRKPHHSRTADVIVSLETDATDGMSIVIREMGGKRTEMGNGAMGLQKGAEGVAKDEELADDANTGGDLGRELCSASMAASTLLLLCEHNVLRVGL